MNHPDVSSSVTVYSLSIFIGADKTLTSSLLALKPCARICVDFPPPLIFGGYPSTQQELFSFGLELADGYRQKFVDAFADDGNIEGF